MVTKSEQVLLEVQEAVCDDELHPELIGLKGTVKRNWIRSHFVEFKNYHAKYGPWRTKQRFGIRRDSTLKSYLEATPMQQHDSEYLLFYSKQALEISREASKIASRCEARLNDFEPMAKLGYAMVEAICKVLPGVEYHPVEAPDRLRLE